MRKEQYILKVTFAILLAIILAHQAQSQNISQIQYISVFNQVDSMLNEYVFRSSLVERRDAKPVVNPTTISNFKELFADDATIEDDLALGWFDQGEEAYKLTYYKNHHNVVVRSVDEYCQRISDYFNKGISVQIKAANVSYEQLSGNREVRVGVVKFISAIATSPDAIKGLLIDVSNTVEIIIVFDENYMNPKIKSIKSTDAKNKMDYYSYLEKDNIPSRDFYIHQNDQDKDFIPDEKDRRPQTAGYDLVESKGMPGKMSDRELDSATEPNKTIDIGILGGIVNSKLSMGDNPFAAYSDARSYVSTNQSLSPQMTLSSYGAYAGFSYYFGKKAQIGVGLGIQYLMYQGSVSVNNESEDARVFKVSYREKDTSGNEYRRIVSAKSGLKENFKASQIGIPLLLKWKGSINQSFKYELSAGVIYGLTVTGSASFEDNQLNYEGIYTWVESTESFGYSAQGNPNQQLHYTEEAINRYHNGYAETALAIAFENGSDFGLNKKPVTENSENDFKFNSGLSWIFAPTVYYGIKDNLSLSLGAYLGLSTWSNDNDVSTYYLSKKVGEYNTMMKGIKESSNTSYGLNLGLRLWLDQQ